MSRTHLLGGNDRYRELSFKVIMFSCIAEVHYTRNFFPNYTGVKNIVNKPPVIDFLKSDPSWWSALGFPSYLLMSFISSYDAILHHRKPTGFCRPITFFCHLKNTPDTTHPTLILLSNYSKLKSHVIFPDNFFLGYMKE